jgi:hypothetical protein
MSFSFKKKFAVLCLISAFFNVFTMDNNSAKKHGIRARLQAALAKRRQSKKDQELLKASNYPKTSVQEIKQLIRSGAHINMNNSAPLLEAVTHGSSAVAQTLIYHKADTSQEKIWKGLYQCKPNDLELLELFLISGAGIATEPSFTDEISLIMGDQMFKTWRLYFGYGGSPSNSLSTRYYERTLEECEQVPAPILQKIKDQAKICILSHLHVAPLGDIVTSYMHKFDWIVRLNQEKKARFARGEHVKIIESKECELSQKNNNTRL